MIPTQCGMAPGGGVSDLPTGTVTFLFTDLEGSTRLWEQHPEAMRAALARHDEILRDAVEKRGGHVVKTTGDGLPRPCAHVRILPERLQKCRSYLRPLDR